MSTQRDRSNEQKHRKPYKCSLCEASFLREAHLKRHLALRKFCFEADPVPKVREAHFLQIIVVNNTSAHAVALLVEGQSCTSSFLEIPAPSALLSPSSPLPLALSWSFLNPFYVLLDSPLITLTRLMSTLIVSDVLLRHIRTCDQAQQTSDLLHPESEKQSRSKKACNRCAEAKVRCNALKPCQRCEKKSLSCEYTRKGYSDPYEEFRIPENTFRDDLPRPVPASRAIGQVSSSYDETAMDTASHTTSSLPPSVNEVPSINHDGLLGEDGADMIPYADYVNASFLSGYGPNGMELSLQDLDWDSILTLPDWNDSWTDTFNAAVLPDVAEANQPVTEAAWQFSAGLQLQQVDSVEGKCIEIRNLLASSQTGLDHSSMSKYITRDRLVNCIQLYARHFQSVEPIIHLPTFDLTKTAPVLLAAMMLVGACYSNSEIPAAIVVQCAIHLLIAMDNAPVITFHFLVCWKI